ncbi:hypothetical protein LJK88_44385 [Paenibacillus sp. P26]|nr:hypothetical protein LJK88_44385 [Paenibacillus sp. P26]
MNKRTLPWILLTAVIGLYGGSWLAGEPLVAGKPVTASSAPPAVTDAREDVNVLQASWPSAKPEYRLERVNGVSVTDDLKTLYEIKGEPSRIETDPLLKHERVFVYPDCRIGLYDNFIQYVVVPGEAGTIEIDGRVLELKPEVLRKELGEPSLVADDGIVYRRGQNALKIFLDANGKLTSVHLFSALAD